MIKTRILQMESQALTGFSFLFNHHNDVGCLNHLEVVAQ